MPYLFPFEKLTVWKSARKLAIDVYRITKAFPVEERFNINSQLQRAAVSVASNIAEGSSRSSRKDQARFYEIAYGSLMEALNLIILSHDLKYMEFEKVAEIRGVIEEIARMLNGLMNSIAE